MKGLNRITNVLFRFVLQLESYVSKLENEKGSYLFSGSPDERNNWNLLHSTD